MTVLVNVLILLVLALILFFSVIAIIRGCKGIKISKSFDPSNKKVKVGYLVLSIVHMSAGILVTMSYVIAGFFIISAQQGM